MRLTARLRRSLVVALTAALAGSGLAVTAAAPAAADTAPPAGTPATVSADSLPTTQIDDRGVVRDQAVGNGRVYVTGSFSSARPAGAAPGSNQAARSNVLAYDLATGALDTGWTPSINAEGKAIALSADGSRVFVAGSFTAASGATRYRIAAFNATTGALITSFAPSSNGRINSIAVSGNTLYLAGTFSAIGNQPRGRLAAVDATTGALLAWAPTANAEVLTIVAPAGSGKVVAGGKFTLLNGQDWYGMGALDATTGESVPWAATQVVRNAGTDAAIYSLSTDGTNTYGTGYTFGGGGNFEGTFSARSSDGGLNYVTGCRGDTYDSVPIDGVLYHVGHPHDCGMVQGLPQTDPWTFQFATAQTTGAAADGRLNTYGAFGGRAAPELLHWLPTFSPGTVTGASQAAWTISGNDDYVVAGGEFQRVNNTPQMGLARFAVRRIAPNQQGPQGGTDLTPTLLALEPGRVRVSWRSAWDRDNRTLTYEVLRGAQLSTAQVVATRTAGTSWWDRPNLSFTDLSPAGGTQTYRIRASDPTGIVSLGTPATIDVPAGTGTTSAYRAAVQADGPDRYWPLDEPSGAVGYDWVNADDLRLDGSATRGAAGALPDETASPATTFPGTATVPAVSTSLTAGPDTFTAEAWIRTTSTTGGKIIGFGSSATGGSGSYDRHVYLTNEGRLVFGVYPGSAQTASSTAAYNDGRWHHVVAAMGPQRGMELFVDGARVGRNAGVTGGQPYSGYWRVGGDSLGGWPGQPATQSLAGTIDEVAVYPSALTLDQVRAHYLASGRTLDLPSRPTDAYGAAVWDAHPAQWFRLDETGGTAALDRVTNNAAGGTYSANAVLGEPGSPVWTGGRSARLPGGAFGAMVSSTPVDNPAVYSAEVWFRTGSTDGGRILGFGNGGADARSGNYDRHVYMLSDGRLRFGTYDGSTNVIDTPAAYNDGQWHHVVAAQGPNGMQLYVDGQLRGTNPAVTPQAYTGFWRLGTDNTWGGANTDDLAGSLDEFAVYDDVLPAAAVAAHWRLGAPNQLPTAAFGSTTAGLRAEFDGRGSADADGGIASYAWQFGDGETGTGAQPEHTYAAPGTYAVTLVVTDDRGATGTVTRDVTVTRVNVPPTAAFAAACTNLACEFDSAASADSDGTIVARAWTFGDGGTGTGAQPAHGYAATGTYTVTLTVTDDAGGTASSTRTVAVTGPPAAQTLAADAFGRSVASGWGSAETGGGWTVTGAGSTASVGSGSGRILLPAGRTAVARLGAPSNLSTDLRHTVWAEAAPTGGGVYAVTAVRITAGGEYRARLRLLADGTVTAGIYAAAGSAETLAGQVRTVPGVSATSRLRVRVQAEGSAPTTLRLKVWADGSAEPATWLTTVTDGTAALQGPGSIAFEPYVSGSSTAALALRYDDLTATTIGAAPNQPPVAAFTSSCADLVCSFGGTGSSDPDGTVTGYAWQFGDGATATGGTATRTFAAAGSYPVTLTVTDDRGATHAVTRAVTVTAAPPQPARLAADTFARTVASGFGAAETGGAWSWSGTGTTPSVSGGTANATFAVGRSAVARLAGVSSVSTDLRHTVWLDTVPTGGGMYLGTTVRSRPGGDYRARLRVFADGSVQATINRVITGVSDTPLTGVTVPGLTYTAGMRLNVRVQAQGDGSTTLRAKVWRDGTAEPAAWTLTATDATAALQGPGSVGLDPYLSGSATAPVVAHWDDLVADPL